MLNGKKITIGLTGGIAAYKVPILIRMLKKAGAEVRAIMTTNSAKFITPLTIETVSQNPVASDMFPADRFVGTHHIDMAEWPDLFVIAPATANFIAKIASGICDDLLSTVICATKKPVMIALAMNTNMYLNPITQGNIDKLKALGYRFINPGEGELACETVGVGRMAEPDEILAAVKSFFQKKKPLTNKKVVVTAGPCREAIDPVRYISNHSSGKMGYALAEAAVDAGADVILISGPTALKPPTVKRYVPVETTEHMYNEVKRHFAQADILIMAAAPADFTMTKPSPRKIKKTSATLKLELTATIDILKSLRKKTEQKIIGFALETENGLKNARAKFKDKNMDIIILNSLEDIDPFGNEANIVTLIGKSGRTEKLSRMTKAELAHLIIERIANL